MPVGGEDIGRAYIKILADGSGFGKDVRRQLKEFDDDFEAAGKKHGKAYDAGFQKEWQERTRRTDMLDGIYKAMRRGDLAKEFFSSGNWEDFKRRMRVNFKDVGEIAVRNLEDDFRKGRIDFSGLTAKMQQILPEVERATRQIVRRQEEVYAEAYRMNEEFNRKALANLRESYALYTRESQQLLKGERGASMSKRQLIRLTDELREKMDGLGVKNAVWADVLNDTEKELRILNPRFRVVNANIDLFADRMGKAFGRGARNNFVNFMGSMVRGLIRLPRLVTGVLESFTSLAGVGRLFGGLSGAVGGAFAFVGPLVSMLSLSAGAVTALASSLALGLVGAAGAAAGALLPLVAGIGTMVAAFQNAPPEARRALRSIKQEFSGLGDIAGQSVFGNITEQAERFRDVIGNLRPVVRGIGTEISEVGDHWLGLLENRGFTEFRSAMEDFLPEAVGKLGRSLGNALSGAGGLFRGLIPLTQRFLTWLEQITDRFSDWANSDAGQRKIVSFFKDAGDSAAQLGDFLDAAVDLLGTLMRSGRNVGDTLFGDMEGKLRQWNQFLNTAQGQRALRDWFEDAGDFARALGNVITHVGELADVLDSAFARGVATGAIDALRLAIEGITWPLRTLANLFGEGESAFLGFAGQMAGMALAFRTFGGRLGGITTSLGGFVGNVRNAETRMGALKGAARGAAGIAGMGALAASASTSNDALKTLATAGGGAMMGFSVGGPIGAAIGGGAGLLAGFAQTAGSLTDSMKTAKPVISDFASTFDQVTGAATRSTRAMAAQELQAEGGIRAANNLGISTRDLVSAVMGQEDAQTRVNKAINEASSGLHEAYRNGELTTAEYKRLYGATENLRLTIPGMTKDIDRQQEKVREAGEAAQTWGQALRGVPKQAHTTIRALGAEPAAKDVQRLIRQYDLTPKQVQTTLRALDVDVTRAQAKALTTNYKNIPKKVETRLDALNWDVTAGQIAGLREQYELTPRQVRTIIQASGIAGTDKEVRALIKRVEEYGKLRPKPKADVDTRPGEKSIDSLTSDLVRDFAKEKGVATADVDNKPGNSAIDHIGRVLANWGNTRKSATADANNAPAASAIGRAVEMLNVFGSRSATANVDVRADTSALAEVERRMNNLSDRTITVTTRNVIVGGSGRFGRTAEGGVFSGAQTRLIGEAGPEAVVPLNRNLSQVDPAVRWLSALAQDKSPGLARGGVSTGPGKTVNVTQNIYSPQTDPKAVATEALNHLVATGY